MTNRAKPYRGHLTALPETPVLVLRRETASETKSEMLISGSRRLDVLTSRPKGGVLTSGGVSRSVLISRSALLLEGHVVDGYVYLGHFQASEAFDATDYILANSLRNLVDAFAVGHVYCQVHRGLLLTDLDGEAAGPAQASGDAAEELPDGGGAVPGSRVPPWERWPPSTSSTATAAMVVTTGSWMVVVP